jgi:hypothetical protein
MADARMTYLVIAGGNRGELSACLASLAESAYRPSNTLVVDNSPGGLSDDFSAAFPDVAFERSTEPRTFAHGVNFGFERALAGGAEIVFLLNDDVTIEPDAAALLAEAEQHLGPGIYAPEVHPRDGSPRVRRRFDWKKRLVVTASVKNTPTEPVEIDYAEASAALISTQVWKKAGGFDEWFGFYYEDADFSLRARAAGLPVCEVPGARVVHSGGATAGEGLSPFKAYWRARNTMHFARKHRGRSRLFINALYHFGGFVVPEIFRAVIGPRRSRAMLSALARGMLDAVTGRIRPPQPR